MESATSRKQQQQQQERVVVDVGEDVAHLVAVTATDLQAKVGRQARQRRAEDEGVATTAASAIGTTAPTSGGSSILEQVIAAIEPLPFLPFSSRSISTSSALPGAYSEVSTRSTVIEEADYSSPFSRVRVHVHVHVHSLPLPFTSTHLGSWQHCLSRPVDSPGCGACQCSPEC